MILNFRLNHSHIPQHGTRSTPRTRDAIMLGQPFAKPSGDAVTHPSASRAIQLATSNGVMVSSAWDSGDPFGGEIGMAIIRSAP